MENKSELKISDLTPEVALRICEHLGDRDILNAVDAIPTWNWIESSAWFKAHLSRRISQWSWIDRCLYKCLFPQPSPHFYRDPRSALEYRLLEDNLYANQSHLQSDPPVPRAVRFLVYPPSDDDIRLDFEQVPRQSENAQTHLEETDEVDEDIDATNDRLLHSDFAIFFTETSEECKEELHSTAASLKPHHTFGVAVIKDVTRDKRSDFQCLLDFLNHLGGLDKSPLAESLFDWRVWCVHQDDKKTVNTKEMRSWLKETTVWKRKLSLNLGI